MRVPPAGGISSAGGAIDDVGDQERPDSSDRAAVAQVSTIRLVVSNDRGMTGADLARAEYLAALRIAVRRPSPAADRQRLKALARLAIAAADARGRP